MKFVIAAYLFIFSSTFATFDGFDTRKQICRTRAQDLREQNIPTLNNIGYLGSGYDVIFANPHPTESKASVDPGYRSHIFDLSYCGELTADQRYQVPENVTVRKQVSGQLQFNVHVINSTKEFAKVLGKSYQVGTGSSGTSNGSTSSDSSWIVKIVGDGMGFIADRVNPIAGRIAKGIGSLLGNFGTITSETTEGSNGLAFSGSRDFKHVTNEINSNLKKIVETSATCTVYKATLNQYAFPTLNRNFRMAVETLPTDDLEEIDEGDERYVYFFREYGTHLVSGVLMGASYGERYTIDEKNWQIMASRNFDWKLAASRFTEQNICKSTSRSLTQTSADDCNNRHWDQSGTYTTSDRNTDNLGFSQLMSDRRVFTVGSLPPGTLQLDEWITQTFDNPVPVHLTLDLIVNVLVPKYFPDDPLISKRRAGLLKSLSQYCEKILQPNGHVTSCEPVTVAPRPKKNFSCVKFGETSVGRIEEEITRLTGFPQSDFKVLPVSFNNKFYFVMNEAVNRHDGYDQCRRLTLSNFDSISKLVIMERESEFQCITRALQEAKTLGTSSSSFWVGMSRSHGNRFSWDSGLPFTYTQRWADKEPNNNVNSKIYKGRRGSSEDLVVVASDGKGLVDSYYFYDLSEIADWPNPLCESDFHRLNLSLNSILENVDDFRPIRYSDRVTLFNRQFSNHLASPNTGLVAFAHLSYESTENERKHIHFIGPWKMLQQGWFYEQWAIDNSTKTNIVKYGDIVQITNHFGQPVLDAAGSYKYSDMSGKWRRYTDDLWIIKPCEENNEEFPKTGFVIFGDCSIFENFYYKRHYLYAYNGVTGGQFVSSGKKNSQKQIWLLLQDEF